MFVIIVRDSQEVEVDINTCGMLTMSRIRGGYCHCGRGLANNRVCSNGLACITTWSIFPLARSSTSPKGLPQVALVDEPT
jgi:hypothetical protein